MRRVAKVSYPCLYGAISICLKQVAKTESDVIEKRVQDADVVIIGGGIVGTALAFYLSKMEKDKKHLSIIVLDKSFVGSGASGDFMMT